MIKNWNVNFIKNFCFCFLIALDGEDSEGWKPNLNTNVRSGQVSIFENAKLWVNDERLNINITIIMIFNSKSIMLII